MEFSIEDFFSKYDQIKENYGLVPFTEKILSGKIHFCTVPVNSFPKKSQSYMFDTVVNGPLGQVIF